MTQHLLKHGGYTGSVEVSLEDACLHGRILHIDDLVTYEGETVAEIGQRFIEAVDEYLAHCASIGKQPGRPYSGTFNVRLGPVLHRQAAQWASSSGVSINDAICQAVEMLVRPSASEHPAAVDPYEHRKFVLVTTSEGVGHKVASSLPGHPFRVLAGVH